MPTPRFALPGFCARALLLTLTLHAPFASGADRPVKSLPINEEKDLLALRPTGDTTLGAVKLESAGSRTFASLTLNTPSDDAAQAWASGYQISLPDKGQAYGPIFELRFEARADKAGRNLPATVWGISEEGKPVKVLTFQFLAPEQIKVNDAEDKPLLASGESFKQDGFVSVRLVFDLETDTFDLSLEGKPGAALRQQPFLKDAKVREIYRLGWGGAKAAPGSFAVDNLLVAELASRTAPPQAAP